MPSRCVRRRAFRVRIFQVHKLERIFITEAMTQVGSWNKLFNDIVSREDVRLRVMQELMRDPQSGAAHYLRDLRAQNLSPEEFEQQGLKRLMQISPSHLTDLYVKTQPLK
ncbi:uncharacterized protein LOC118266140 [Spodoptera frugiperda]|uniref:Uncharacterized protein LOC118266140 n=1 Tax=Spodoptera frugiperda TaxID=7108 RepID=A0A9R0EHQ6_SPOFR|nr:uncharacterized protein LOC118266140 [Spodoptera frugiperda]